MGQLSLWSLLVVGLLLVRFSKGVGFTDIYALITRPFWPGPTQRDWIVSATDLENQARLQLLEQDNRRLRQLLELQRDGSSRGDVAAAVIARSPRGWWQQLELGKGALHGLSVGNAVLGPGGLVGRVASVTPATSRVKLLTAPGHEIGVWLPRSRSHGLLVGHGNSRLALRFIDKDPDARPGDLVTTSPASTLLPPNVSIGVIQSIDSRAVPAPIAMVQLIATPEAIDWVQVRTR
ncbi:rod shape-determining protein MreC [Synechococcus sp. M16CYN]